MPKPKNALPRRALRSRGDWSRSSEKIADWTAERDSLAAEIERAVGAERQRVETEASRREDIRLPINRADVRALEWYVLWS